MAKRPDGLSPEDRDRQEFAHHAQAPYRENGRLELQTAFDIQETTGRADRRSRLTEELIKAKLARTSLKFSRALLAMEQTRNYPNGPRCRIRVTGRCGKIGSREATTQRLGPAPHLFHIFLLQPTTKQGPTGHSISRAQNTLPQPPFPKAPFVQATPPKT